MVQDTWLPLLRDLRYTYVVQDTLATWFRIHVVQDTRFRIQTLKSTGGAKGGAGGAVARNLPAVIIKLFSGLSKSLDLFGELWKPLDLRLYDEL